MNRSLCLYTLLVLLVVQDLSAQDVSAGGRHRNRHRHRHRHFYQQVPGDTKINFNNFDGMLKGEQWNKML